MSDVIWTVTQLKYDKQSKDVNRKIFFKSKRVNFFKRKNTTYDKLFTQEFFSFVYIIITAFFYMILFLFFKSACFDKLINENFSFGKNFANTIFNVSRFNIQR